MRAVVLSGGGSHGAYEIGVLKKLMLFDKNNYDIFAGISVGAINAAMLSQYASNPAEAWQDLKRQWDITTTSRIRKSWFLGPLAALWKPSVYNSAPLEEWLQRDLNEKLIKTSGKKLRIVAVSLNSGESVTITEQDNNLSSWVAASAAFPVMFKPVTIGEERYLDGGVRSVTPLGEAILAGATDIDVIMCANPDVVKRHDDKKSKTLTIAGRTINLLVNQIMRDDLKICKLKNNINGYKPIKLRIFKPDVDLDDIMDSLDFNQDGIQKMINLGFESAMKQVK